MRWLILLFSLALLPVRASVFPGMPGTGVPWYKAPSAFSPSDISGMAFYWNHNDLSVGTVTTWTDRIQGLGFTQGDSSKRPTNSTTGVWFDAGKQLTNSMADQGLRVSVWFDFTSQNPQNSGWQCIVCDKGATTGWFLLSSSPRIQDFAPGGSNTKLCDMASGVNYVVCRTQPVTTGKFYTNNVQGANPPAAVTGWILNSMGSDNFSENYAGYIRFLAVWTNYDFTATDVQNLYTYSSTH
jgi:hypothetical protein